MSEKYWSNLRFMQIQDRRERQQRYFKQVLLKPLNPHQDAKTFIKFLDEHFARQDHINQQKALDIQTPHTPIKASL